ncbi:MAG: DUF6249 domain-containing protein [Alphaproteobacteria bacterium]|nr:DUF6249 domain-containing protein [Alphaproteobacteria bacterium]
MDLNSLGGGLAAFGFWGFVAAIVVAGMWYDMRIRQARHETLRRMIESGQTADRELIDKLVGGNTHLDRNLKVAGLVLLALAPGIAVLAWLLSYVAAWALLPLLGVAVLVLCIAVGLLIASRAVERMAG